MSYIKQVWYLMLCIQVLLERAQSDDDVPEPVGLFPLNSRHKTKDISNSYLTGGTAVGVSLAPGPDGKPDSSYKLAGNSSSYIEIPQQAKLDTRYSITILLWVYNKGTIGPILFYESGVVGKWALHMFMITASTLLFRLTTRHDFSTSPEPLQFDYGTKNIWRYVGYTYDYNTGYHRLFVDGAQVAEASIGRWELSTNYKIIIGGVKVGDTRLFKGRVSCLQIFDKALTQSQVQAAKGNCMKKNVEYSACLKPRIIIDPSRALDFTVSGQSPDRSFFARNRWYRLKGKSGTKIVTSCPAPGSCGAQSPGWLNGQYPTIEAGIKKMEICYRSGSDCCANKATVYVRQCYGYPVFMLDDVPDISLANRFCTEKDTNIAPNVMFKSADKKCLTGRVIKTVTDVLDDAVCMTYCLHSGEKCKSFNYVKSLNGTCACQLNNATMTDYPAHVTVDSSCRYYQRTAVMSYIIP